MALRSEGIYFEWVSMLIHGIESESCAQSNPHALLLMACSMETKRKQSREFNKLVIVRNKIN